MNINDLKARVAPTFEKKDNTAVERSRLPGNEGDFSEYNGKTVSELLTRDRETAERLRLIDGIIDGYNDYLEKHDFHNDFIENPNYAKELLEKLKAKE